MRRSTISLWTSGLLCLSPVAADQPEAGLLATSISFVQDDCRRIADLSRVEPFGTRLSVRTYRAGALVSSHAILLRGDIYQFQVGDIDGDGSRDLCLGVDIVAPYDPVKRKRLFLYRIDEGYIRPLWLGTHVGMELQDFRIIEGDGKSVIRTLETDEEGLFYVGRYRWAGFGPGWLSYPGERLKRHEALRTFAR